MDIISGKVSVPFWVRAINIPQDTGVLWNTIWTVTSRESSSCVVLERLWQDAPRPKAEKPQQNGRRDKIAFRIKPHTCQRCSEGSNKPCEHQDPGTPQRLRQNCVRVSPVEVRVSSGLPQGQGLWVPQTWVWHKPSWRRLPLTSPQGHQNLHRTGETDSWVQEVQIIIFKIPKKGDHIV